MRASCIIVCEGAPVSKTIQHLAEERVCVVISTPHDTYTVARLINQSMPVKFFMKKDNLKTFHLDDYTDEIKISWRKNGIVISPSWTKTTAMWAWSPAGTCWEPRAPGDLVDHNEASQAVDNIESAEILEIIDHHRLGSLETMAPVYFRNQPVGCTGTIMYQIYTEKNLEIPKNIAGLLCAAIISDTLMFRSPTCTAADRNAAENLARIAGIMWKSLPLRCLRRAAI